MKRRISRPIQVALYITVCTMMSCHFAKASTYLECKTNDVSTCTKEVSKGETIIALAKNPKLKFVKVDYIELNEKKGTLNNVSK